MCGIICWREAHGENFVGFGNEGLSNVVHFRYLGSMQSSEGDSLFAINYRIAIAWSRNGDRQRFMTASRLPKVLRLRLLNGSVL